MMDFYLTNEEVDNFLRLINLNREDCSVDYLQKIIENTINNIPFQNLTMLCNNREIPMLSISRSKCYLEQEGFVPSEIRSSTNYC